MPHWNTTERGVNRKSAQSRSHSYYADREQDYDGLSMMQVGRRDYGDVESLTILSGVVDEAQKDRPYQDE
jgi:hypothetical protein